jgi:hypothetical protein
MESIERTTQIRASRGPHGSDPVEAPVELYHRLLRAWSIETSDLWRSDNPACGQCSVTALVAQDVLGGDILKTKVGGAWHFYNRIDGRRWDLTVGQFATPIGYDDLPCSRHEALADTSKQKYLALVERLAREV